MDEDEGSPTEVGPYHIIERLGVGSFATVYRAQHRQTRCIVALKAVRKSSLANMQEFELLQQEVNVMKDMDHPFIASFFELLDDDYSFFLAIELVGNGNLLDYINLTNGLTESQARRLFYQLVNVLDYLHREKHVVHRDLKAENVLLDSNHNIRVVDFGLSKAFSKDNPFLQTTCGSPGYVSPEIIREEPYTSAADVWSAGILLFAMLTGTLPFDGDNLSTMLNAILTLEPAIPPHLSPELRDLLQQLLIKDPEHRITIGAIMSHPWMAEYADAKLMSDDHKVLSGLKIQGVAQLDVRVIEEMKFLRFDVNGLLEDVNNGQVDGRTAVYKMLRRKFLMDEINTWQNTRIKQAASVVKEASATLTVAVKPGVAARVRKRIVAPKVPTPVTKLPRLHG
jgi:serine/threonine protein kinase